MIRSTIFAMLAMLVATTSANADLLIGGTTLTDLVAADDFNSGGSAGNTVKTTGSGFFSTTVITGGDVLWHDGSASGGRLDFWAGAGFAASVGLTAGDVLEDERENGAAFDLTTSIFGLAPGTHDVYVAYLAVPGGNPLNNGGIRAALTGNALTSYGDTNGTDSESGSGTYSLYIAYLGSTADGATSFSVDVAERTDTAVTQNLYVGVGYFSTITVPEPSSMALLGLGAFALFVRRRK